MRYAVPSYLIYRHRIYARLKVFLSQEEMWQWVGDTEIREDFITTKWEHGMLKAYAVYSVLNKQEHLPHSDCTILSEYRR